MSEETAEAQTEEVQEVQEPQEVETVEEPKPKPKPSFEERKKEIARKTWEMRENERRAKDAFTKAQEYEQQLAERESRLKEQYPDEFKTEEPKPKQENRSDEEIAKSYLKNKEKQKVLEQWGIRREEAILEDPKFEQKEARIAKSFELSGNVEGIKGILESDKQIEVVNYLNDNPDDLERIANLSPIGAMRAIVKIESTLGEEKPPSVTKAPNPINPVKGGGAPKSIKNMSWEEFCNQRNKEEYGR